MEIGMVVSEPQEFYAEWKFDYFGIPKPTVGDEWFESPKFRFAGVRRCFVFRSEFNDIYPSCNSLTLEIAESSQTESHSVNCTLGIKKNDGNIYKCVERYLPINERFHIPAFIHVITLTEDEHMLDNDKSVTFFCRIRHLEQCKENPAYVPAPASGESEEKQKKFVQVFDKEDTDILVENLSDMYKKQLHSDVVLKVGEHDLKAHKDILVSRSPVFASMFEHDMLESRSGTVSIHDCDPVVFRDFLEYLYTAKVEDVTAEKMIILYSIADKYVVQQLKRKCVKYLEQNPSVDAFCDAFEFAFRYDENELLQALEEFFLKNGSKIRTSIAWESFSKENPNTANELITKLIKEYKEKEQD